MANTTLTLKQPTIQTTLISKSEFDYSLVIEPILPGFGPTLGNSLRRVMLSSVPGYAVTKIKINDDITHEYQAVKGSVEDSMQILLNLKLLRAKILTDEKSVTVTLNKKGGEVTAADFVTKNNLEIINKDLHICTLDSDAEIKIEVEISSGVGYLSIDKVNLVDNVNPQNLLVDAMFSPVSNVSLRVDEIRVGDMTNYNKITLDFTLDGTVEAQDVMVYVIDMITELLQSIKNSFVNTASIKTVTAKEESTADISLNDDSFEGLESSKKDLILGIFEKNQIKTNADLLKVADDLEAIAGLDESMIVSINKYIDTL